MSRICKAPEVSRSNLYERLEKPSGTHKKRVMIQEQKILPPIHQITDERPTYGYRQVTALLRKSLNEAINSKRVYLVMKEHSLLLQKHGKRPVRVHDGKIITLKSNLRWCSDHFSIQCWNGEQVHVVFVLDCNDREFFSWMASNTGIDGQMIRDLMIDCVESRFGSINHLPHNLQWLSDNDPAYVARLTFPPIMAPVFS